MRKGHHREDRPAAPDESSMDPASSSVMARWEIFGLVFTVGAAIMAIEILGTRIIGPVFGVNLFVWSALLAVTLGALAVGYYAGGVWIDRTPALRLPGFIVVSGGV